MQEDPPRYFILEDERDRFINIEYDYIYLGCAFDVNIERYVLISSNGFHYLFPDDAEKMSDLVGSKDFETSEQALEYVRNMLIGNGFKIVNKELLVYA
jgi:hypothetical protein